jgi:putative aldouronate transport system substrate-binding protein
MKAATKRGSLLMLAMLMAIVLLAACSGSNGNTEGNGEQTGDGGDKIVSVKYVIPGSLSPEHDKTQAAINEKLKADGVPVKLEVTAIPWDAWSQKTNIMLSTGEEFELMHAMEDVKSFTQLAGSGALASLDELIDQYGPNLKKAIPDYMWDAAKVNGKIYTIPAKWIDFANGWYWVTGREDLLQKYNLPVPTTREELIEVAAELQQKVEADTGEKLYIWSRSKDNLHAIYRDFPEFPFTTDSKQMFVVDKDGNAQSYVESDIFKQESQFMRELYEKGLISKDIISIPQEQMLSTIEQGKFLFYLERGSYLDPLIQKANPDAKVKLFRLQPEKETFRPVSFGNSNVVPITSLHPEAGIQLLNWVYGSQENYDLFMYGIQGEQWNKSGDDRVEYVRDDKDKPLYQFPNWMVGNLDYARFGKEATDLQVAIEGVMDDAAVNSPIMGFVFDSNPVSSEYANVQAEIEASIIPIKNGVVDYDSYYPEALKKLKAAGLDKIMAEYNKQLEAWKAQRQ